MAIPWTNLFADLGEMVSGVNALRDVENTVIPDLQAALESQLATSQVWSVLSLVPSLYDGYKDGVKGSITSICGLAQNRLTAPDVLAQIPVSGSTDVNVVLKEVIRAMLAESESVKASTVTIGSVTPDAGNVGDGTLLLGKVMDGVTAPGNGYAAYSHYAGRDSELANSETLVVTCTADTVSGSSESYQLNGDKAASGAYDWRSDGSGSGTLTSPYSRSILKDGGFNSWTNTNTPSSWTIVSGTAGTTILRNSSPSEGTYCLEVKGNGATASIGVKQTLTGKTAGRMYVVVVRVKGDASIVAGKLEVMLSGTGYSPGVGEKVSMNAAALAAQTGWGVKSFLVLMPANPPADMALSVTVSETLTNNASVLVDAACMAPANYFGGVVVEVVPGLTSFMKGDRLSVTLANDNAGKFQEFFRRWFKVQLPTSDTPTITEPEEYVMGSALPAGGTAGQVLAKTANGYEWKDVPALDAYGSILIPKQNGTPAGGQRGSMFVDDTNGAYMVHTGVAWQQLTTA